MFKKILKKKKSKSIDNSLSALSKDGTWIYSQFKSGTTYNIIFLINYMKSLKRLNLDEEKIFKLLPYFHSLEVRLKEVELYEIKKCQNKLVKCFGIGNLVHTHKSILDLSKKRIFLTRNPFDYLVSSYFYFYKNRGGNESLFEVWESILSKYIIVHKKQLEILALKPDTTLFVKYEDLITNPKENFKNIIDLIGLPYDEESLDISINQSQKKDIKKIEEAGGNPIVASSKTYKAKSFIRSGEIGDWKNYIDDDLKKEIEIWLEAQGVNLAVFVFE